MIVSPKPAFYFQRAHIAEVFCPCPATGARCLFKYWFPLIELMRLLHFIFCLSRLCPECFSFLAPNFSFSSTRCLKESLYLFKASSSHDLWFLLIIKQKSSVLQAAFSTASSLGSLLCLTMEAMTEGLEIREKAHLYCKKPGVSVIS